MITKIGVNILAKTAVQQEIVSSTRENRQYYHQPYEYSLRKKTDKIIEKHYPEVYYEISSNHVFKSNGEVLNAIIFEISHLKPLNKTEIKEELKNYIDNYFKRAFNKYR